jgi:ADP-L-glycero-D-manno-heptose 6-epimerase
MIVITGAAGFIASALVARLNEENITNLILVDDFSNPEKNKNLLNKKYENKIERMKFVDWFAQNAAQIDFVFHLGARTDTAEFDWDIFLKLNLNYSKSLWDICTKHQIPLVYASSAATYGNGECGYDDRKEIGDLKPLNPYGDSKQQFDLWVEKQEKTPPFWAGLKFFNVYGPNEFHKSRMASVIFHAFNQIQKTEKMNLFRSHRADFENGEQSRDFIYVKDVVEICTFLMQKGKTSGLYNVGTGKARTFLDLVKNTFKAMNVEENISFIDTPADIRDKYQYFTEASMEKLRKEGYDRPFFSLEEGVEQYVKHYLLSTTYF